jgi:CheY-like chemotaxis protein
MTISEKPELQAVIQRAGASAPVVLIVDDDHDIGAMLQAILVDEGYSVSCLYQSTPAALNAALGRLEPDCILLDSMGGSNDYGEAWEAARKIHERGRPVPVVMFTGRSEAVREARANQTERSQAAGFVGVLSKPFDLDDLLSTVANATGQSIPFDRSREADAQRTQALVAILEAEGVSEIHTSTLREWAIFRLGNGRWAQLYWWQALGVYYAGEYREDGAVMEPLGQFTDVQAAVACALAS